VGRFFFYVLPARYPPDIAPIRKKNKKRFPLFHKALLAFVGEYATMVVVLGLFLWFTSVVGKSADTMKGSPQWLQTHSQ
jgi:hypothetical protein